MSQREYYNMYQRLKSIREEIAEIKQRPYTSIKDRIESLRKANILLKEQNRLLVIRQSFLQENNIMKLRQTG